MWPFRCSVRALRQTLAAAVFAHHLSISSAAQQSEAREYAGDAFGKILYRPHSGGHEAVDGVGVGIVNEEEVYFASRHVISAVHDGALTPLVQVGEGDITAFHLCHHRNSLFFEVAEAGGLSIFEYSLISRSKAPVKVFQDIAPATSLACMDRLLLRSSPSSLLAVNLQGGGVTVLRDSRAASAAGAQDALASLAVRFAADVFSQGEVYATVPANRSVVRLTLQADAVGLPTVRTLEPVLIGRDGGDGPLTSASALRPERVVAIRDRVIVADGCSLREIYHGRVRTLLGSPSDCASSEEERLEPVPWATRVGRFAGLAAASSGTARGSLVALTEGAAGKVVLVSGRGAAAASESGSCASRSATEAACSEQHGCGWAEGEGAGRHLCLDCPGLQRWANGMACDLEQAPRAGTRYRLGGCGCAAPSRPQPGPGDDDDGTIHHKTIWAFLVIATLLGGLGLVLLVYRQHRRTVLLRDDFGNNELDTAEFHTFTDDDCG